MSCLLCKNSPFFSQYFAESSHFESQISNSTKEGLIHEVSMHSSEGIVEYGGPHMRNDALVDNGPHVLSLLQSSPNVSLELYPVFAICNVLRKQDIYSPWDLIKDISDKEDEVLKPKERQKEHDENVKKVVKCLKQRNPSKDGLICTARKPWIAVGMRNVDNKRARHFKVDLSSF